jgi:FdhE protein
MTRDAWVAAHPYLRPVAELHALVDEKAAAIPVPSVALPHWDDYGEDFRAGVPLLESSKVPIDLAPLENGVRSLTETLASSLPEPLAEHCRAENPGLLRYLRATILVRYLHPVVGAFGQWRDEERWLRNYCPLCGTPPAMAQLIGVDPGRLRLLSCGCCTTRWRYRRTGCPFCESRDDHRLAVVDVEGESGLRIDYCDACRGYLKTYNGEGSESVLLADWTSLHLDILARDRGLKRLAASLYEL